jgi:peptidoglycan/LPS O-acetylase OafA/YrhL
LLDAQIAVLFFFITSGFYMALTINEVYARQGEVSPPGWRRAFYLSRILRLYPAYLATLAGMVLWFHITHTSNVFLDHPNVPLPAFLGLVFMNVFIVGQDFYQTIINSIDLGETNNVTKVVSGTMPPHFFQGIWIMVGQAWSLGSELLFYLMAPFIVRSVKRIIACICIGLAIRWGVIFGLHGFNSTIWGYNFFPATCCLFCLGSLCYHLYPRLRHYRFAAAAGGVITAGFAVFALVSTLRWHSILQVGPAGLDTGPLWSAYILYAVSLPLLFCCWRQNKIDRWVGELSYPLYLVHGAVIGLVFAHIHAGQMVKSALVVVISIGVAALVFMCIDRPVDAWRHRHFGGRREAPRMRPAFPREWLVLAFVLVLILTNTLRLDAFAQPVTAPALLVVVDGRYNIVAYNNRLFGVPQGDPITFGAPGYDQDKRLIIGTKLSEVSARINGLPKVDMLVAVLVAVDGHYNIVKYNGRVFGVLQGEPIVWGAPGYDTDKRLIIAATIEDVRALIAAPAGSGGG